MSWFTRNELSSLSSLATEVAIVAKQAAAGKPLAARHRAVLTEAATYLEVGAKRYSVPSSRNAMGVSGVEPARTVEFLLEHLSDGNADDPLASVRTLAKDVRKLTKPKPARDIAVVVEKRWREVADAASAASRARRDSMGASAISLR